jgi:hypothetical protein
LCGHDSGHANDNEKQTGILHNSSLGGNILYRLAAQHLRQQGSLLFVKVTSFLQTVNVPGVKCWPFVVSQSRRR